MEQTIQTTYQHCKVKLLYHKSCSCFVSDHYSASAVGLVYSCCARGCIEKMDNFDNVTW